MKTPREILLNRHQAAKTDLDRIRREVVSGLSQGAPSRSGLSLMVAFHLWCPLIGRHRRAWAGLAAVWVVILGLNFSGGKSATMSLANGPTPVQMREALRQKKLLLSELAGRSDGPVTEPRREFVPQPRSDRRHEQLAA